MGKRIHDIEDKRILQCYDDMKARCYNPNNKEFRNYGARGIVVCDEWLASRRGFVLWARSSGYQDALTLDRRDSDLGYSPNNCRWATLTVQARNKRPISGRTSEYTGVSAHGVTGKWLVAIGLSGGSYYLGVYTTEIEAAHMYVAYTNYHATGHTYKDFPTDPALYEVCTSRVKENNFRVRSTSGFKGVTSIKSNGRWVGKATIAGHTYNTASTTTPEEAARLYDALCHELGVPHKVNPPERYKQ